MERSDRGRAEKEYFIHIMIIAFFDPVFVGFGLIMIYSTSSFNAEENLAIQPVLNKAGMFALIGIAIMLFVSSTFDYRRLIKPLPIIKIKPVTLFYTICIFCKYM